MASLSMLPSMHAGSTDNVRDDDVLKSLGGAPAATPSLPTQHRYVLNKWTEPIMEAKLVMYVPCDPLIQEQVSRVRHTTAHALPLLTLRSL